MAWSTTHIDGNAWLSSTTSRFYQTLRYFLLMSPHTSSAPATALCINRRSAVSRTASQERLTTITECVVV